MSRLPSSSLLAASLSLLAYGLFVWVRLAAFGYDPTAFVVASEVFVDAEAAPAGLRVLHGSSGYDGQFFYRLALDPFSSEVTDFGIRLDAPAYRQQRIGYPLLAWLLSGGSPRAAAVALIALNALALGAIGWLGGELARASGRHALWGLVLAFYPGFVLSLARDLSEITAATGLLGGVLLAYRGRFGAAALAMTAAALCRETVLVVPAAFLAVSWLGARGRGVPAPRQATVFLLPLLVFVAWQLVLLVRWHEAARQGLAVVGLPGMGIAHFLQANWPPATRHQLGWLLQLGFVVATALLASRSLVHRRGGVPAPVMLAWAIYLLLVVSLSDRVWVEDFGFLRAYTECYLAGALLCLDARWPGPGLPLAGGATVAGAWLLAAAQHAFSA